MYIVQIHKYYISKTYYMYNISYIDINNTNYTILIHDTYIYNCQSISFTVPNVWGTQTKNNQEWHRYNKHIPFPPVTTLESTTGI
jgi:hypothetical protein